MVLDLVAFVCPGFGIVDGDGATEDSEVDADSKDAKVDGRVGTDPNADAETGADSMEAKEDGEVSEDSADDARRLV